MNVALIGCGPRGEQLAAKAAALDHTVAVCADTVAAQSKRVASRLGVRSTSRVLDALSGVDAVLFAEPAPTYTAAAQRALRSGVHMFWNAPLTHDPKTALSLLDAAKASGVVLASAYPNRVCPQYAAAAVQVESGAVGTIGFVRVHRNTAPCSNTKHGAALDSLAGDIDFVTSEFGAITTVFAQIVRKKPVDSALLTLTVSKGPIVQCAASVTTGAPRATIELCGASGMIQFATHEPILSVHSHSTDTARMPSETSPVTPDTTSRRLAEFFASVKRGRTSAAPFKHELHVVRIVEAALESARTGRAVKVKR